MRTILAAVDQSQHSHAVIRRAAELGVLLRTDLVIFTVQNPDPMKKSNLNEERSRIVSFQRELVFKHFPKNGIALESNGATSVVYRYNPIGIRIHLAIASGNPVESICNFAEQLKADLVIVGNRGLGGVGGLVLGSVSERVVHKCSRTVMVVKGELQENSDWEQMLDSPRTGQSFRTV